jgi:phenylacetate-coenzyme A ligase PaaK-like adenylate-forming protein
MNVEVYRNFLENLKFEAGAVKEIKDIPFLPIQLFKTHKVSDQPATPEFFFSSSGTTGQTTSKHFIADLEIYQDSLIEGFQYFYGDPSQYCFLALLPSYLERGGSSLVYMVNTLIEKSVYPESGFYLNNLQQLNEKLISLTSQNKPVFLIGVSYALLDLFESFPVRLNNAIVMETGGMKGRRKEMIRKELHEVLAAGSGVSVIHSEYGMTELLSQAYALEKGNFRCPPWMKVFIHEIHDPFQVAITGDTGNINVIDLANIHSCAFVATQDLGKMTSSNSFEVLGRIDAGELRGCNLMII